MGEDAQTQHLCADQRERWRRGDRVRVETYLAQHPFLGADDEALLDLIYNEIVLRQEHGDPPRLDEYLRQFGRLEEPIRLLFEVHEALEQQPTRRVEAGGAGPESVPAFFVTRGPIRTLPAVAGYDILGVLGEGGMGVVYQARHERLRRVVALKMLRGGPQASPRALARFQTEVEVVARLQHPNIVPIYEVGEHEGEPFFAMEFVAGGTLTSRVDGTPQPAREAARTVAALARAMHHAHQRGVVHRDLKPSNVLLTEEGVPRITDFGLAKYPEGSEGHTRSGDVLGTPSYMAPEQAAGKAQQVGPATDVYALGAILYELLTGRPPFKAETPTDTLLQVLHNAPVPPSRLRAQTPRDLETICLKCLEKEPHKRYATAEALADDLDRFLEGRPVRARRSRWWEKAVKWARRRPAAAALLAVSALAVLGLGLGWEWHARGERHRQARARGEVLAGLSRAQDAFLARDWAAAHTHLEAALSRVNAEAGLEDLRPEAEGRLAEAGRRQGAEEGERRAAAAFRDFLRLRDEAHFHGMNSLSGERLPTGTDPADHRRAGEAAARQALAVAGVDLQASTPWAPDPALSDPGQREEMAAGCYTLVLILADVVAGVDGRARDDPEPIREALRLLERAPALHAPTAAYHLRRARYRGQLGETAGLSPEEAAPSGALDYFLIGYDDFRAERFDEARRAFDAAVSLQPDHFWAQWYLGKCHWRRREWDQAKSAFTACIVLRPQFVWPLLMRADASGQQGAWASAETDYDKAERMLARAPDDKARWYFHVRRGVLRFRQGRLDDAAADFRQAIAVDPQPYEAHFDLFQVYLRQKKEPEAERALAKALSLGAPPVVRAEACAERGRVLLARGDRAGAAAACRSALEQDANHFQARGVLAQALLEMGHDGEAAREFDQYLQHGGPPNADVYRGRGQARMRKGDFLGACDDYTLALGLQRDPELSLYRGWSWFFAEAYRPGLRDFENALWLPPHSAGVPAGRALGRVVLGQYREAAAEAAETLRRLRRHRADAYTGRGLCRVMLGRYREAAADADNALRLGPEAPEMLHNVACTFALAVGRVTADSAAADRSTLAACWRSRAVATLRQALARVPAEGRPRYWRENVAPDPALDPIRPSPEFQELIREYGGPRGP
jgi:tetratricopeptide (TPR) repeat protein/predicted Ser/Thr protein kinase